MLDLKKLEDWKDNVYVCFETKIVVEAVATEVKYEFAINFNNRYRVLKNGVKIFEGSNLDVAFAAYDCEY